jgi:hypothetical protein
LIAALPLVVALAMPCSFAPPATGAGIAPVGREDFATAKAKVVATLVGELAELAEWCQKNRAYLERDRVYEALLEFDGDHAEARKTLGYRYDKKQEEWVRPRPYKTPKNAKPEAALEALEKRGELLLGHRERMLALLAAHKELDPQAREAEIDEMLAASPDDPQLRALKGEVQVEDEGGKQRWVPVEVRAAMERRKALAQRKRELFEAAPKGAPAIPDEAERELGVEWTHVLGTDRVRVYGNVEEAEVADALQATHAAWDWLPPVLGGDTGPPPDYRIYLVEGEGKRKAFIDAYPELTAQDRLALPQTSSSWLASHARLGCWGDSRDQRVDSATRQTVSSYMFRTYGITGKHGWIEQGWGLYLTQKLVGTRLSFAVRPSDYSTTGRPDWASAIHDDDANFLVLARQMLKADRGPNLAFVFGKDVNEMTTEDMLFSFAIAAYLVEGQAPETLHTIIRRVGKGDNPATVLEDALGYDLTALQARLLAWLTEMKR